MGVEKPIRLSTGREWDKETGLYYYRARYYDPMDGNFISKDPIGFKGGINLYSYVGQNPINRIDPSGLAWQPGQPGNWPSPYPAPPPYPFPGGQPPGPGWYPPPRPGDSCLKPGCFFKCILYSPTNAMPLVKCALSGFDPANPSCWQAGGNIGVKTPDCYEQCKGRYNSCGVCE